MMTSTFTSTLKDRRPRIACEFSPTHIVAARAAESGVIDLSSMRLLPPGALAAALVGTNISGRDAVRTAIRETVAALGPSRDVGLILPDACCRLVLIDLDVLPEKQEEADTLVRLRLKKSLPFDIEKACVSWQVQSAHGKTNVLAAVVLSAVLEEYESVAREAGCSPGLVLPSILASLGQVDASVPTLLIKVDFSTISIAIVNHLAVLLVRVLDRAPAQLSEGAQLADDVHPSLAFFQDAYGTKVQRILVSGVAPLEELNSALEESTSVRAQELVQTESLDAACGSQRTTLGAVVGALV